MLMNLRHILGQWEEDRVPGENPRRENMQTTQKGPCQELNQEPSCCEVAVLSIAPSCCLDL